jgi:hypothetical protein
LVDCDVNGTGLELLLHREKSMATGAKLTSWRDQHKGLAFTYARVFDYDFALLVS